MQQLAWEEKVWGRALHCFGSEAAAVSVLEVKKGFRCSRHLHRDRVNRFVVQSGEIEVVIFGAGGAEMSRERMRAGCVKNVMPGVEHRFEVLESGVVVEVYFPLPVAADDILRFDTGGPI